MTTRLKITIPQGYAFVAGKGAMKRVMRRAGAEVAAKARALIRSKGRVSAPDTPPVSRTGLLARSLRVRPWSDGEGVTILDDARSRGGSGAPYALFLESGVVGGIGSGKKGVKGERNQRKRVNGKSVLAGIVGKRVMQPRPFLTIALEQVAGASVGQRIVDAVTGDLDFKKAPR